jgi:hypothetical protein
MFWNQMSCIICCFSPSFDYGVPHMWKSNFLCNGLTVTKMLDTVNISHRLWVCDIVQFQFQCNFSFIFAIPAANVHINFTYPCFVMLLWSWLALYSFRLKSLEIFILHISSSGIEHPAEVPCWLLFEKQKYWMMQNSGSIRDWFSDMSRLYA